MQKIWVLALLALLATGLALRAAPRGTSRRLMLEILFGLFLIFSIVPAGIFLYFLVVFRIFEGPARMECAYNLTSDISIKDGKYHASSWDVACEAAPGGMFSEVTTTSEVYIADAMSSQKFRRSPPGGVLLIRSLGPIRVDWSGGRLHVETPKRDIVEDRMQIDSVIVDYHFT